MSIRRSWVVAGCALTAVLVISLFWRSTRQSPFSFTPLPVYRSLIHARFPDYVSVEKRLEKIDEKLQGLPAPSSLPTGGALGFGTLIDGTLQRKWARLEWDKPQTVDALVLVPAQEPKQLIRRETFRPVAAYEVTLFFDGQSVHQFSFKHGGDALSRGGLPYFGDLPLIKIDAVEVSAVPVHGIEDSCFAVGELAVFSGFDNIAPKARLSSNGSLEGVMGFSLDYLVDERTSLGLPQIVEDHPFVGYTSGGLVEGAEIWIELWLDEPCEIDEVRFFPVERVLGAGNNAAGYPQDMNVLVRDMKADGWRLVHEFENEMIGAPELNPVPLRFDGALTDRVGLHVRRFWKPTARSATTFALAEVQLRNNGIPVDVSIDPKASVSLEMQEAETVRGMKRFWSREGLVDGMSTKGRILQEKTWYRQLAQRAELLNEKKELSEHFSALTLRVDRFCWRLSTGIPLLIVVGLLIVQLHSLVRQQQQLRRIQDKLAADLHDDLGSNLSSILICAQRFKRLTGNDFPVVERQMQLIRDSIDSLKELVSFTSPRITTTRSLIDVLRSIAETHCGSISYSFEIDPDLVGMDYPPDVRRNLRFFLKEVLGNAVKHSEASQINIRITRRESDRIWLEIQDNGIGLPDDFSEGGTALSTLRLRAKEMQLKYEVKNLDKGCLVRIRLPEPLGEGRS